jgi:hypothetical protein
MLPSKAKSVFTPNLKFYLVFKPGILFQDIYIADINDTCIV